MSDLLPVGSVVSIKKFDKLYIICSADSKEEYQYILAPYPIGITQVFLVRKEKKENITKVWFSGYIDNEYIFNKYLENKGGN